MKKVLVMLLCSIMLLGLLAGCAENGTTEQDSTQKQEEESHWISPELTETDEFSGKTLNLLANREMDAGSEEASSDHLCMDFRGAAGSGHRSPIY